MFFRLTVGSLAQSGPVTLKYVEDFGLEKGSYKLAAPVFELCRHKANASGWKEFFKVLEITAPCPVPRGMVMRKGRNLKSIRQSAIFRKTASALIFNLILALAMSGCGVQQLARGEIQAPKVQVEGVTLGTPTAAGWPVFATLRLENPNPQSITVLGYDYQLQLEGQPAAQGTGQGQVVLPPGGETVTQFPILVNLPVVLGLLPRALQRQDQKLHYRLAGGVRLGNVAGGLVRIPFSVQGEASPKEGAEFLRSYVR